MKTTADKEKRVGVWIRVSKLAHRQKLGEDGEPGASSRAGNPVRRGAGLEGCGDLRPLQCLRKRRLASSGGAADDRGRASRPHHRLALLQTRAARAQD